MKTKSIIFALLLLGNFAVGQENYLWLIPGKQAGEDILYRPQDYIGVADAQTQAEFNFGTLIIGAPLGTPVLCPVDGKIHSALLGYRNSWSCSSIAFDQQTGNYEQDSLLLLEWDNMTQEKIHNICLFVGIQTADGKTIWIDGMRSTRLFKTGEPIHRGDTLGTVGYVYKRIKQPCISVSISKNSKPIDPMTPFGLKTTFIPPKVNNKTQLTREEAQADIDGMMEALEDAFPGLYDYTPKEEFDNYIKNRMAAISKTISRSDFEVFIFKLLGKIHDSHTAIISEPKMKRGGSPSSVCLGWFNDTLQVWRIVPRYKDYLGKPVVSVNGIPADSLKTMVLEYVGFSDGYVKSYGDYVLLYGMDNYYCDQIAKDANLMATFADGETKHFEPMKPKDPYREPQWLEYQYRHFHANEETHFDFEKLSDTVAYLALHTFELDDLEMEQLTEIFANLIADSIPNLILDLRFNHGGPSASVEGIYAYLAQKPFCTSLRKIVNKKNGYACVGSCPVDDDEDGPFADYEPLPNGEGFVKDEPEWRDPDSLVNYKGRLYVLTNETSFSASTCFAGWVKKQNRGVIVGRETGSTYHQMKAENFTQYQLPNSNIAIQIPMIKIVFDTVTNERFPYGRGVLPDYPVNFTPEELSFVHGDSILNYTLQLIRDGKYIYYVEPELETTSVKEDARPFRWWWIAMGVAAMVVIAGVGWKKRVERG